MALTKRVDEQSQAARTGSLVYIRLMTQLVCHDLGDVGGRVEQIREPSHEGGDLHLDY